MTASSSNLNRLNRSQSGMATLMFAVVLLIALTVITFLSAKTLLTEQAISANEYRSKEVSYAAEAALEYGIAWLDSNDPGFASWNNADLDSDGIKFNDLSAPNTTVVSGSNTYNLSVDYIRRCLEGATDNDEAANSVCEQWIIEVEATATAASDSDLSRKQWIRVLQTPNATDPAKTDFIRIPGSWRDW
ncbi:PilX N-terminal domain-containing pilus assembly protein [Oceanospirillum sp. HFRX-1_2]